MFTLRFGPHGPVLDHGRLPSAFREDCADIAASFGLRAGSVRGVRRGGRVQLVFSADVDVACQQRLRNAWQFHAADRRAQR